MIGSAVGAVGSAGVAVEVAGGPGGDVEVMLGGEACGCVVAPAGGTPVGGIDAEAPELLGVDADAGGAVTVRAGGRVGAPVVSFDDDDDGDAEDPGTTARA